ncbi:MAG TPA: CoB--CoM heterodisulfide reductase iron-sulfur subunit A family protein [candidate division Zixibacteria bacterium]|nr:CoB--CoM heterodisulfide reductase iron-sulfur subunit A family protein [candidate division Zixibacteria bacterium]
MSRKTKKSLETARKETKPRQKIGPQPVRPRIGVFVCQCGSNIASKIDVDALTKYAMTLPNVVHAENMNYPCSRQGQDEIIAAIKNNKLERVVVAGCSPRLYEPTFQSCVSRAELNPWLFEMANIREFASYCHQTTPVEATEKAKDTVRMAVAKARLLEPLKPIELPVTKKVMVIGGGIAGINAALDLADMGFKVYMVEKTETIGGYMALLDKTFPTLDCSICIEGPKMVDVGRHPNIEIISYADVLKVEGYVGNFKVKIRKNPRYVIAANCTGCGECRDACPIEYPNYADMFLGARKAISIPFGQAVPLTHTINRDYCIECYKCVDACGARQAINFDQKPEEIEVKVGAIVVTIGYGMYNPKDMAWTGYGEFSNVFTALEFERLILAAGPTGGKVVRASDGQKPHSVAFIQCVGSRDINRYEYCSSFCCMYTLKHSVMLKEKYKDAIEVYVFYNDMRSNFKGYEEFYNRAQKSGVKFIRVKLENRKITEDPHTKNLTVCGETEDGKPISVETEMVVLANAAIPSQAASDLAKILNIPLGKDGFFVECQPKIRPTDTEVPGIFLAGACQGLKDIPYSVAQGSAAAAQAASVLSKDSWTVEPLVANVNEELCSGCRVCESACSYHAINVEKVGDKSVAKVTEGLCRGCGICSSACPMDAVTMPNYSDCQIVAEIQAVMKKGSRKT